MEGRPDAEGPILEAVEAALAAYRGPAFDEVTLRLPWEFAELCRACLVSPELVLRGFIADLCGLQCSQAHPRADGYTESSEREDEKL